MQLWGTGTDRSDCLLSAPYPAAQRAPRYHLAASSYSPPFPRTTRTAHARPLPCSDFYETIQVKEFNVHMLPVIVGSGYDSYLSAVGTGTGGEACACTSLEAPRRSKRADKRGGEVE